VGPTPTLSSSPPSLNTSSLPWPWHPGRPLRLTGEPRGALLLLPPRLASELAVASLFQPPPAPVAPAPNRVLPNSVIHASILFQRARADVRLAAAAPMASSAAEQHANDTSVDRRLHPPPATMARRYISSHTPTLPVLWAPTTSAPPPAATPAAAWPSSAYGAHLRPLHSRFRCAVDGLLAGGRASRG
jgi:hypothetical protein